MPKKPISDEEMDELLANGCIGLCPICGMPVYADQEHEEPMMVTSYSLERV